MKFRSSCYTLAPAGARPLTLPSFSTRRSQLILFRCQLAAGSQGGRESRESQERSHEERRGRKGDALVRELQQQVNFCSAPTKRGQQAEPRELETRLFAAASQCITLGIYNLPTTSADGGCTASLAVRTTGASFATGDITCGMRGASESTALTVEL